MKSYSFCFSTLRFLFVSILLAAAFLQTVSGAFAQVKPAPSSSTSGEDIEVEALYDRLDDQAEKQEEKRREVQPAKKRVVPDKEINQISDLAELSPYEDIAVISRKFLPKTKRFELSFSPTFSTNNAFFTNLGAAANLAFYFSEKWGVEGTYLILTDTQRDITKNLDEKANVETRSLVVPKSFIGAFVKWIPVYGKLGFMDRTIVPYDLYFRAGAGMSGTAEGKSEPTVAIGMGQIFARSKKFAFRWDLLFNVYQATVSQTVNSNLVEQKTSHNDLFLGLGVSFFIPEASYR